jgi:hypothetical protein
MLPIAPVCGSQKSINAAYQSAKEQVGTSIVSVYSKLKGIDVETSAELVRFTARQAGAIIEDLQGALPPLLPGYRRKILDGNCIEATEHRIKELRGLSAGAFEGPAIVKPPALPVDSYLCHPRAQEPAMAARRGLKAETGREDRHREAFRASRGNPR